MLQYVLLEAKRQWRNREALIFRLGIPTAAYLMLTAVGEGEDTVASTGLRSLPSNAARMVALAALGAVVSGLAAGPALGEERANGWLRQLRVTPLPPRAAVAAKIVASMSFALPSIALVVAAAAVTGGTGVGALGTVELVALMWLATAPLTAIGTVIGLRLRPEAAQGATTLAFMVLWLLGGIFTMPTNMPDPLAAVSEVLPSYAVVRVGWASASGETIPIAAIVVLAAWTAGATALAAAAWRRVLQR